MDDERLTHISEAIRVALNDTFGVDGDDVMIVATSDGEFEADIPYGESLDASGFVQLEEGYECHINGERYIVELVRKEDQNMYFSVGWEF